MKHISNWIKLMVVPAALMLIPLRGGAQPPADSLLAHLADRPIDITVLVGIERQPVTPETLSALEAAFSQGGSKHDLQLIAVTTVRLGDKSERYYDYLAGFAREAIKDATPFFPGYDTEGHEIRGKLDPGFENWCALNGKDPMAVVGKEMVEADDVYILASANDVRSRDLLRSGLDSPNLMVAVYSIEGLGRIQDWDAIPLIEKVSRRVPRGERLGIAMGLPWFTSPQADRLLRELVPDSNLRDDLTRDVRRLQAIEIEAAQRRTGTTPPK